MNSSNPTPSSSKASAAPNKPAPWSMDHWTSCLVTRKGTPLPRGTVAYAIGAAFPTEHLRHIAEAVCTPEQIEEECGDHLAAFLFQLIEQEVMQTLLHISDKYTNEPLILWVLRVAPGRRGKMPAERIEPEYWTVFYQYLRRCGVSADILRSFRRTRRGVPTPAQKAAKAAKMIRYLSKTHEKVEALVSVTHQGRVDPARVQVAMKILDAVSKALDFLRLKNSKAPGAR